MRAWRRDLLLVLAFAAIFIGIAWNPNIDSFIHRDRYRSEVRALFDALALGSTREQVWRELQSGRYPDLKLNREIERFSATAPIEFGGGNWLLLMEFEGNGLGALRIRTADSLTDRPTSAPHDRLATEAERK